jgi:hypothetical protein
VDKMKQGHRAHTDPDSENHGFHRPYWKHAHHDWRLWIVVGLMIVAMLSYVMSDDLAWRPHRQLYQPASGAAVK